MKKTVPAISVIIPMYNTEKYVGECLDSILAQTFTDFEVIVVDDCSTDKSCDVVESYMPKFTRGGGRLQLIRSEKNSGSRPGIPRNTGIRFARGEYIFFVDSDDAIIPTALHELYTLAKKFDADVVHCEKYYKAPDNTVSTDKKILKVHSDEKVEFISQPTLFSKDIEERVRAFATIKFIGYTWNKLIRRELIVKNEISFPMLRSGEDHIFSFCLICLGKNLLRIPNPVYVWRNNETGMTHGNLPVEKMIHRWVDSLFRGVGIIDKFMNQFESLQKKIELRHMVFDTFIYHHTKKIFPIYAQIPAWQLDPLIRRELDEVKDKTALTAFLFARMNIFNVQLIQSQNLLSQQPKEVQDFQRQQLQLQQQQEIIRQQQQALQQQAAQIKQLQQQLKNVHDIFK